MVNINLPKHLHNNSYLLLFFLSVVPDKQKAEYFSMEISYIISFSP